MVKPAGMRFRELFLAAGFALLSMTLVGASCDKKSLAKPGEVGHTTVGDKPTDQPPDQSDPADPNKTGGNKKAGKDVPGVDTSKLNDTQKGRFNALLDKVQSPCGKAHSLRTSLTTDKACKRAIFAGRYLVKLLLVDLPDEDATTFYDQRYQQQKTYPFDLAGTPYEGVPGAAITIVEFFDYGCPHCKLTLPVLEDLAAEYPSDLVIYFKHFPLSGHKDSVSCAIAAIAAQKQGKFREMHRKIFANQEDQSKEALFKHAKAIGLDMKKFQADFDDPKTREKVMADRDLGEKSDLEGTPTVYINGRMYTDPPADFESLKEWVDEELAVNR